MHIDLPLDLLRTFVAVADLGSVTQAASRIGRSQPAVTQQLRRLEGMFDHPLFIRERRRLRLSQGGEALISHARRMIELNDRAVTALSGDPLSGPICIGLVQDFAEPLLTGVIARFAQNHPDVRLDVQVGGSSQMRRQLADGRLDMALCVALPREDPLFSAPMAWLGASHLAEQDPLPLALIESHCTFRDMALLALEQSDIRWRQAVGVPSLCALSAAVRAGLGLTVRPRFALGAEAGEVTHPRLPPLKPVGFVLLTGSDAGDAARLLSQSIASALATS